MADDASSTERLEIELSASRIEVAPGGVPVEVVLVVRNESRVVDQCTIEVVGLDPDWFTHAVRSVALFPGDSERLTVAFHVPAEAGLRAGAYPFSVVVRSRSNATERRAEGVLSVQGQPNLELDLAPRRQVVRTQGRFRIQLTNSGLADGVVTLEASDAEEGLTFQFPGDRQPLVPAHGAVEVPLVATPRRRPWVGPEHTYEFVVKARRADKFTEVQAINGQLVYQPRFASLNLLGPVRRLVLLAAAVAAALVGLTLLPADARCRLVGENNAIPLLGRGCGIGEVALTGGTGAAAQPTGGTVAAGGATPAGAAAGAGGVVAAGGGGGGGPAAGVPSPVAGQQAAGLGGEAIGGGGGAAGAGVTVEGVPTPAPPAATAAAVFMAGVDATQAAVATVVATATVAPAAATRAPVAAPSASATARATTPPTAAAKPVVAQFQPGTCSPRRQAQALTNGAFQVPATVRPATPTARAQTKPTVVVSPTARRPTNEWSQSDPTAWWSCTGVTADQITQLLKTSQARLVDVEVEQAQPSLLFSAVLVANQGAYARDWWWYYGLDDVQVQERLASNTARPIALRAYDAGGKTRFAVVMVSNKAPDVRTFWWFPDLTKAREIDQLLMTNRARLIDVDPYVDAAGTPRFAVIMLANNGLDQANAWWFDNITPEQIGAEVTRTGGHVIDIEPNDVAAGTFDVVLEGCPCARNWWATGLDEAGLTNALTQTGGRITSLATYLANGQRRFAVSLIDNS